MLLRYRKFFFQISVSLFFLNGISGCNSDSDSPTYEEPTFLVFEPVGLENRIIYKLDVIDETLYAATDRGLFRETSDGSWQSVSETNWNVIDWVVIDDGHWLLTTLDDDRFSGIISRFDLYESADFGASWQSVQHNFGGEGLGEGDFEVLNKMILDGGDIFALGNDVLASSSDNGKTWEVRDGIWGGFATGLRGLAISQDKNTIWYGGQGGFENITLRKYDLLNQVSLDFSSQANTLLPSPSSVLSIRYSTFDEEHLFVSAEGGIIQSKNDGESWQTLILDNDHKFYFDLIIDSTKDGYLYTAGWSKTTDPQPLIVEISIDAGETWRRYRHADNSLFGGVYSMTSRVEDGETVLYLGLYRGGVIRVSNLPE